MAHDSTFITSLAVGKCCKCMRGSAVGEVVDAYQCTNNKVSMAVVQLHFQFSVCLCNSPVLAYIWSSVVN